MLIKILVLLRFLVFYSAKNYVSSSFFPPHSSTVFSRKLEL